MGHSRGRQAPQAPWRAWATRLAVPAVMAVLAATGMVATSGSTGPSVPATSVVSISAAPQPLGREHRTSRSAEASRTALAEAAQKKAAKAKAANAKVRAEKAKAKVRAEKAKAKAVARAKAAQKVEAVARAKAAQKARATARADARARAKAAAEKPPLTVVDTMYTRVDLNVRTQNEVDARLIAVLNSGSTVAVTRTARGGWRYISYRGAGGWVKNQYLVQSKPRVKAVAKPMARAVVRRSSGFSSAACSGGSAVERGLTPDAVRVHRAICARFPSVKSYGGVRADSLPEHPSGRALDAMIPNRGTGWEIANYVRANAKRLGVSEVLFDRRIWTVQRGGEGWRTFPDRGSVTANHQDHVHVSVYGDSGGS